MVNPTGTYVPANDSGAESSVSAVSWPAILGGAFVATAISISLLFFGTALGFASVSPWKGGPSPVAFTAVGAIWLIIMQWVSSGLGGYITGRMRTKWARTHTHEVFFRDTANGFITWAVSTVATAILVATVLSSIAGGGIKVGAIAAASMPPAPPAMGKNAPNQGPHAYVIDTLFRSEHPTSPATTPEANEEATRILLHGIKNDALSPEDRTYLAQVVSARTGLAQQDAEKRVDTVYDEIKSDEQKVKQAADSARKTAATVSLFMFLSLLVGAFIACVTAALGGRQRDLHY